jgi:hypothetical protein
MFETIIDVNGRSTLDLISSRLILRWFWVSLGDLPWYEAGERDR